MDYNSTFSAPQSNDPLAQQAWQLWVSLAKIATVGSKERSERAFHLMSRAFRRYCRRRDQGSDQ